MDRKLYCIILLQPSLGRPLFLARISPEIGANADNADELKGLMYRLHIRAHLNPSSLQTAHTNERIRSEQSVLRRAVPVGGSRNAIVSPVVVEEPTGIIRALFEALKETYLSYFYSYYSLLKLLFSSSLCPADMFLYRLFLSLPVDYCDGDIMWSSVSISPNFSNGLDGHFR